MSAKRVWNKLTMGVCYYPEHWNKSLWRDDLRRMKAAGISVIRIGEFAWNKFEPEEGMFVYDFFDEFLALCLEEGMDVIFGTPTPTPPAWLTEKYPEVLNALEDGTLLRHGCRRHYNYNSPKYRELSARIVEKIAAHLGKHPAIVGWQIDNEFNCGVTMFYSEADSAAFRVFLQKKYGSLEALNEAWGTVFWNQDYTDWEQIYVPRTTPQSTHNPHHKLDYLRFISESTISYCGMQAEILRRYISPEAYITTNGLFGHLDNHRMTEECLDVYTYDSYPNFAFGLNEAFDHDRLNDRKWSRNLTEVRSICPHFGIMEQQSGGGGWVGRMESPAPRPGQMKLWSLQSIAHGADLVSYFRWRTCTFGTEMYWHGILDYDNRDNRRLREAKEVHQLMEKIQPVAGAENCAAFAMVKDYDNLWDTEIDVWHQRVHKASEDAVFETAQRTHTPYDVLYLRENTVLEDLLKYPVLLYPHGLILKQRDVELFKAYVEQGGTLIVGCRTGQKDEKGHCVMRPMPGLLSELTGTEVEEFTFCSPTEEPVNAVWDEQVMPMPVFNDILTALPGTTVLACYQNSYYAGKPALTENRVGKGRVLHLGSTFSQENLKLIFAHLGMLTPWNDVVRVSERVELVVREKEGKKYFFLLNYLAEPQQVEFVQELRSLLSGETLSGTVTLPALGYEVLVME